MDTTKAPVLFIHKLWLHSSSWPPRIELFEQAGYAPNAPGWPGDQSTVDEARVNPDTVANHGIEDVVDHFSAIIEALPSKPIVIGDSFGAMIAEKLLGEDRGHSLTIDDSWLDVAKAS
jgi:pimeloyl-ACP methyl ester carboxylesterase